MTPTPERARIGCGWALVLPAVAAAALGGCGRSTTVDADRSLARAPASIALRSPAFEDGGSIPAKYTCDGADVSPPLSWTGAPEATRSFALIVEDPDAPTGTFTHWTLYGLDAGTTELPEGLAPGEGGPGQGVNDFKKPGYGGPCPPRGTPHRYVFQVFALDTMPALRPGATVAALRDALRGHVLARGRLVGTYARR